MPSSIWTLWTIAAVAVLSLTFACASEPSPTVQSHTGAPVPSATLVTTVSPTVQATIPARTTTAQTGTHHCRDHVSVHTDASAYADAHRRKVPGGSPLEVALIEEWIFAYINEAREAQGFHSLESDPVISDIARDHSASMTASGILSTQINGDGPTDRALAMIPRQSLTLRASPKLLP